MTETRVSNKRLRDIQRVVHILAGVMLGTYIYMPLFAGSPPPSATAFMQFVVFPVVAASGILMWRMPRLRRMWKGKPKEG